MMRKVAEQPALDPFRTQELFPGKAVQTDEEIDAWIRSHAETIYHPVGTCRMGAAGDPMAVVDDLCRVQGLAGLRVVDASVMPTIPSVATNAATVMIGEFAARLIVGARAVALGAEA